MAKVTQQPRAPMWPWGGPRAVRDRLVDRSQVETKRAKKGDPKNPALASAALLDFIAPAHSAEEMRLPLPVSPRGHDADVESLLDRPFLSRVAERNGEGSTEAMERALSGLRASPERVDRLKALLQREAQMLELVGMVSSAMAEIERRRREETQGEVA